MIRAVKVSVCFDRNYITTCNFNTDEIFQSPNKSVRFSSPQIEAIQTCVPPETKSFILISNHKYKTFEELVHHSILENPEMFGKNCVKIVESYMRFHGLNELPDYSIKFEQCFIEERRIYER